MNKLQLLYVTKQAVSKAWQREQKRLYSEKKSVAEGTLGSRWKERETAQESAVSYYIAIVRTASQSYSSTLIVKMSRQYKG